MIRLYRKSGEKLSPNFRVEEFACKDGEKVVLIDSELVERLQALRDILGKPININSAYRTLAHNKKVGGQELSPHLAGQAADIVCPGYPPSEVAKAAETVGFRGIGLYDTFVHVDVNPRCARWDKRGGKLRYVKGFGGVAPEEVDYKALYQNAASQIATVKAALEKLIENLEV